MMIAVQLALAARAASDAGHTVVILPPQMQAVPAESHARQLAAYIRSEPDFVQALLALPPGPHDQELYGMLDNVLRMALAESPDYADLRLCLSRVLDRLGRSDAAMEEALKAVEINPAYVQALLHLARLVSREGQDAEAAEWLDQAISAGADWPDVHCLAGEVKARGDSLDGAAGHFRRALELKADYARAAEGLARLAA